MSPAASASVAASTPSAVGSAAAQAGDAAAGESTPVLPPPVTRSGNAWPFHAYARAEAALFNQTPDRPDVPLVVYDDKGWSPQLVSRKPISAAQMKTAMDLVKDTKGGVDVSKCPFPRHAIVLFDADDVPVASINVCFQCGDILLWPHWLRTKPDWANMTEKQQKEEMIRTTGQRPLHKVAFPKWKKFFAQELGFGADSVDRTWTPDF